MATAVEVERPKVENGNGEEREDGKEDAPSKVEKVETAGNGEEEADKKDKGKDGDEGSKKRKKDKDSKKKDRDRGRSRSRSRSRSKSRSRDKKRKSRSPDRRRRKSKSRSRSRGRRDRDRDRDRDRKRSRSRSRDRSRDRDEKKRKKEKRDKEKEKAREKEKAKEKEEKEKKEKEEKQKEEENKAELEDPAKKKEQEELDEQMRLRRERVARWRAEQAAKAAGGSTAVDQASTAAPAAGDTEVNGADAMAVDGAVKEEEKQPSEQDYFKESDDEEEEKPVEKPVEEVKKKEEAAEEEEEEDPLEAFMKGVNTQVKQITQEDQKRMSNVVDMDTIMTMNKQKQAPVVPRLKTEGLGQRMEEDDNIPDEDVDEEQEKEFDIKQWLESKNQAKNLRPVDHSKIAYAPFKKNFYRMVPEIASMTEQEVRTYRSSLDGIKLRGKHCPPPIKTFIQCGLSDRALAVVKKLGWKKPTPIQCQALPVIMSGRDCIGVAKTGSGKTAAYLLPCLRHVQDQPPIEQGDGPIALIFTPARELCIQVYNQAKNFFKPCDLFGAAVYGGAPVSDQISVLKKLPSIVICTPGRMIDMLCCNGGRVTNLRRVTYLVIDEADRMFDLGFEPQIAKMLENTRPDRQTVLFSATFPKQMESLAKKNLKNPIEMVVGGRSVVSNTIEHFVELRAPETRFLRTLELLGEWYSEDTCVIIFVERQDSCDELMAQLIKQGYACLTLHGNKDQADRDSTLADFKNKVATVLIATSLAARGLDVKDLNLVINYDTPSHYEDYVHRVGRTGRAGNKGTAYTFVNPAQRELIPDLVKALELSKRPVPKDLRQIVNQIREQKKAGQKMRHGSGFGGKGFKFDEAEQSKMKEAQLKSKKLLLIQNGEEVSDEEEQPAVMDDDFEDQAKNLNSAQAQKVADWQAKTVEKESNMAFNDLVKKATGGLLLKDIIPASSPAAPQTAGQIGGVPAAAQAQAGGALVTSDVAARAKAAAAALGLAPGSAGAPAMVGGGAVVQFGANPTAEEAMARARQAAIALKLAGVSGPDGEDHYEEELEINDYPQHARWKATHRESISPITEMCDVCVTAKGVYVKPGLTPPPGERKLYLIIEGDTDRKVKSALAQFKRLLQEATLESDENKRPLFSKYTV